MNLNEDTPDSALFRAICLSTTPFVHEEADPILAELARRGWEITTQGHQRAGEMIITIRRKQK